MAELLEEIQRTVWEASIPLSISLAASECRVFDASEPYLISVPRLSYLPFLLPRLLKYFSDELIADTSTTTVDSGVFTFEGVLLKWQLPVGLLYDIHVLSTQDVTQEFEHQTPVLRKAEPFQLTVHFAYQNDSPSQIPAIPASPNFVHDAFINSVKEADFLRSGTAKPIMSLSATDSKLLWASTQENDLTSYARIHNNLLPKETVWRNVPVRIYLPSTPTSTANTESKEEDAKIDEKATESQVRGQIRVIQSPLPPFVPVPTTTASTTRMPAPSQAVPQTVGSALHALLPSLFPSRRTPILAKPMLHGAVVPMNAVLEELATKACYADGWVNIVVTINS